MKVRISTLSLRLPAAHHKRRPLLSLQASLEAYQRSVKQEPQQVRFAAALALHTQAPAPTAAPATTPATPAQVEAIAEFRPHAERACRALYVRPDDARTCVRRVLDAALPPSLEDAVRPTSSTAPRVERRGTTAAPDGRE